MLSFFWSRLSEGILIAGDSLPRQQRLNKVGQVTKMTTESEAARFPYIFLSGLAKPKMEVILRSRRPEAFAGKLFSAARKQ